MIKTLLISLTMIATAPIPVVDMVNEEILPPRFRKLDDLQASGSAQFSELSFKAILKELGSPKSLYVIDLRNESHGFVNGDAITWYTTRDWGNRGLTQQEAEADEKRRLEEVKIGSEMTLYRIVEKTDDEQNIRTAPIPVKVTSVSDERRLVESFGAHYVRIRVVDHEAPPKEAVDAFIKLLKTLPKDAWIHLHCRGGAGRTTTFLTLYDILKNGKKMTLKEILERQYRIGGVDLLNTQKQEWKSPLLEEKIDFIEKFYNEVTAS